MNTSNNIPRIGLEPAQNPAADTPLTPKAWISEIEFSDGTKIPLNRNDIIVLVGPNNSGKSATLKNAIKLLSGNNNKCLVLRRIVISKEGTLESVLELIKKISSEPTIHSGGRQYTYGESSIYEPVVPRLWREENNLGELSSIFGKIISTERRLGSSNPPQSINLIKESAKHPIHVLQKDDSLEKQFSEYFHQAFGLDLVVHRNAGSQVPLYVGKSPKPKSGEDRVSSGYLRELEKLDALHEQGDGMRSFVGVLLNTFVASGSMLFIDEPEAFLHPPQARLIGKMLAKDIPADRQLFLATHSEDFLKGLLDANVSRLKIVRLNRKGNINHVSLLDDSEIKEVWRDSILRHSNILNGLFHSKVVICESDSDCRFFSAIMSALYDNTNTIAPDIHFVQSGGKDRIPTIVKALKKLGVPMQVIADFDILIEEKPLRSVYENMGGTWAEVESDWRQLKTAIEQKRALLKSDDVKTEIIKILESVSDENFPKKKGEDIKRILNKASPWKEAKLSGRAFIPGGDPSQAFQRIQTKFQKIGLIILDVGELEGFVKSVGNHGPKWVNEVLQKDLVNDPELEGARNFVRHYIAPKP